MMLQILLGLIFVVGCISIFLDPLAVVLGAGSFSWQQQQQHLLSIVRLFHINNQNRMTITIKNNNKLIRLSTSLNDKKRKIHKTK